MSIQYHLGQLWAQASKSSRINIMNQGLIDGLKRRFEMVEKNKHFENHINALLDYFSFIIKTPLLLNEGKKILEKGINLSGDIFPSLVGASMINEDYSLIVKTPQMKQFVYEIERDFKMEKEGKLKISSVEEMEHESKLKVAELEKETTIYDLSTFHNEIIDNLSGARLKISLSFSRIRGIYLSSNSSKYYRPKGASNRLDYLERIIKKNGEPISAKNLTKGLNIGLNMRTVVSSEIKEINENIIDKLGVKNKVILGKDGYKLNTADYDFILG